MANVTSHDPGAFCWIELATTDPTAARAFYGDLFGWTVQEHNMGEMGFYYIFQKKDRDAAAMYQIGGPTAGMPPNWTTYISTDNVDQSTEKARSLGATIIGGPFDVNENGRMSMVTDPQGATFCLWQKKNTAGVEINNESGTLCWNELQARNLDVARDFYTQLCGWTMKVTPDYSEIHLGGRGIGGMMQSMAPEGVPSYWMPYFMVDDCDATTKLAEGKGARVIVQPMEIEKVGRFSVIADPQGAVFSVIRITM